MIVLRELKYPANQASTNEGVLDQAGVFLAMFLCYRGFGYAELNIGDAGIAECSAMLIQLKISAVNLNIACIIACNAEI